MNKCYDNRELSWLKFNMRVLEEATDPTVPICERLLFSSIFQSNLDEFFMIRVGSLLDRTLVHDNSKDNKTGLTASDQLDAIYKRVKEIIPRRDAAYYDTIKDLGQYGVEHVKFSSLTAEEEQYLRVYFNTEIRPLISPQVVDKRHPFPFLKNKDIYAVVHLESKSSVKLGIIPANGNFSRLIVLPDKKKLRFMLAEDVILHYCGTVFENYRILDRALIRITRNADINMEEALYDHDVDLRDVMEELLRKRKKLSPVRLEISGSLENEAVKYLCTNLELSDKQIMRSSAPLEMSFVFSLRNRIESVHPELFYKPVSPQRSADVVHNAPMIPQILKHDILLTYPYESIRPFIQLLVEAGNDPDVISIKITLYRVASNSKIVEALINAAENGKDVFVLVELRARFDEENNIEWSKRLERAGCKVMYGPENLKVHSKLMLITRKNGSELQYITQIGTGNYNEKTSELYTDLSLMTSDVNIGAEAGTVFNALSIGNLVENTSYLMVAPLSLRNKLIELIDYEIAAAESGGEGYIGLKLNSLTDKVLMDKLIEASNAGVKIDMVIRGISCLIAGVPGATENINVRSIVGRFLEHSRIYIFGKGEGRKIYISSADFMTRNTIRRVEVAAPINSPAIKARVERIFETLLADNVKARYQLPDGTYTHVVPEEGEALVDAQQSFIDEANANAENASKRKPIKVKPVKIKASEKKHKAKA
ncbi:MAG: polyphosphate kinase 1 [Huintestinicola sp.]